jgi:hypothetical protein
MFLVKSADAGAAEKQRIVCGVIAPALPRLTVASTRHAMSLFYVFSSSV